MKQIIEMTEDEYTKLKELTAKYEPVEDKE